MESNSKPEKLYLTTKLAFGAGDMGPALTANLLVFFLLPFFTNVAGLSPSWAGSILFIGKIADAVNDPLIGMFSDRTKTKWGRRLPWIIFSAIPFGLIFFLQWLVPTFSENPDTNNTSLIIYYLVVGIVFNLFYTAVNLPYQALTPELTQDYNERTNLNSFRFSFSIGASILSLILAGFVFEVFPDGQQKYFALGIISTIFATIPLFWCPLIVQERGYQPLLTNQTRKKTGFVLLAIATTVAVISLFTFMTSTDDVQKFWGLMGIFVMVLVGAIAYSLIIAKTEPHLSNSNKSNTEESSEQNIPFFQQLKIVFQNRPFVYVVGIYLCSWLAVQLTASILLYFVVDWMGLPESNFPTVAIAVQGTALVMLFVWQMISQKLDKKIVYYLGSIVWILAQIGLFMIQPDQTLLLYLLAMLAGCGVSVAYLIPWSMIPDVIDLDELNTGKRREGLFYGFMVLLQKFGLAFGLFLVGIALEASGFIKTISGELPPVQPDSALWAIRLVVGPLPAVILVIGMILAYFYPITREYHSEIRLQLQERKNSQNTM